MLAVFVQQIRYHQPVLVRQREMVSIRSLPGLPLRSLGCIDPALLQPLVSRFCPQILRDADPKGEVHVPAEIAAAAVRTAARAHDRARLKTSIAQTPDSWILPTLSLPMPPGLV